MRLKIFASSLKGLAAGLRLRASFSDRAVAPLPATEQNIDLTRGLLNRG
jgi:hypothetical protein